MRSLVDNRQEGLFFIVSAPAGTGKTTLVQMLVEEFPNVIASISYTTRKPRESEVDGKHYYFISHFDFEAKIAASDFVEYVNLYGHYYGTSQQWILAQQKQGKHVVLVIDTQGALQLKGRLAAISIFIRPPSLEVLQNRLASRKTETPETLETRLKWAQIEMEAACYYDYLIINDDLQMAYQVLRSIVIAESHRMTSKGAS
jgi:guanylate kinase